MNQGIKKRLISLEAHKEMNLELQSILWEMYDFLKKKRKNKMDRIQMFNIFKMGHT